MKLFIMFGTCCLFAIVAVHAQDPVKGWRSWVAPREADSRQNPLADTPEIRAGGQKVYEQRCSACHGKEGTGSNRGPNLTIARVQQQTDGTLFWKISSGNTRSGMPTFSFLPPEQRWQLVMHVRALAE